jgi:hypothetical protein
LPDPSSAETAGVAGHGFPALSVIVGVFPCGYEIPRTKQLFALTALGSVNLKLSPEKPTPTGFVDEHVCCTNVEVMVIGREG